MTNEHKERKQLEILVVEDNPQHLADGKNFFKLIQKKKIVRIDCASTLKEAQDYINSWSYDGIISDIFFPAGLIDKETDNLLKRLYDTLRIDSPFFRNWHVSAAQEWLQKRALSPFGVVVAQCAHEKNIPVVFNIDTHHHGYAIEPINRWEDRPVIVETGAIRGAPGDKDFNEMTGPNKNWRRAFIELISSWEGRRFRDEEPNPEDSFYQRGFANFEDDMRKYQEGKIILRNYGVE